MRLLVGVIQELSKATDLPTITQLVRTAARNLTGADGATFVLREGDICHYADEDAISPLWKGKRFPMSACISGWSMTTGQTAVIEDIYQDARIPADAYRPTFVKSLVMVPIREDSPIGAIGNYWATHHRATEEEVQLLRSLANSASIALQNVQLFEGLSRQLSLRDDFLSICSHEMNTPLTPMKIQIQLLQRMLDAGVFAGHARETDLNAIVDNLGLQTDDLIQKVDTLLEASRIRMGSFVFNFTQGVDLSTIAREVVGSQTFSVNHGIDLKLEPNLTGNWDRLRLAQMMSNLISNAIKFGNEKPIRINAWSNSNTVHLVIEDQGPGVSKADQARIFERFERAAPFNHFGGMGLGLFISKKIVEGHGGQIRFESENGDGSKVSIELPRSQPS